MKAVSSFAVAMGFLGLGIVCCIVYVICFYAMMLYVETLFK